MPKKSEGIYVRKDGRFEGRLLISRDENGKAKYYSVYGLSKAEVRQKMEEARITFLGETFPAEGKTFYEAAEDWLAEIKGNVAATTFDRYQKALERDIYPEYKNTPMKDVTIDEMNRFIKIAPELAAKRGRELKNSGLQIVRAVMSNIIRYVSERDGNSATIPNEINPYETLDTYQIERICIRAKHSHCQEMLAALLFLFCGLRNGELCALKSDDVDLNRMEIYIHATAHRVSNPNQEVKNKTILVIEEITQKKRNRRVRIPAVLKDYIAEFLEPGRFLIRNNDNAMSDPRTLEKKIERVLGAFGLEEINSERLRMTYQKGRADEQILTNIFLGIRPDRPYSGAVDMKWLTDEMARDLAPLRLLVGLSHGELGQIMGVSEGTYRSMENGSRDLSWDEYLSLLFIFHYNGRTIDVVDGLGLFPQSLKEKIKVG